VHTVPEHAFRAETSAALWPTGSTVVGMAEDVDIRHRITELVELERSLREQLSAGEISADDEHSELRSVETELDQCWDLLRQRQALREFGGDPGNAQARSEGTVEGYLG
jgi:Protein of unknown function (DUF2630)